jgi:hypothetical protein
MEMAKEEESTPEVKPIKRQLEIPGDDYSAMEQLRLDIQKEKGGKKPSSEKMLVQLIGDGLKFQKLRSKKENLIENVVTEFDKWFSLTREDISRMKEEIVAGISSGKIDLKSIFVAISSFERVFIGDKDNPGIKTIIQQQLARELKREAGPVTIGNFEVRAEEGATYDFSSDPQWQMMRTEENVAAEKRKGREDFLKAITPLFEGSHESIEGISYRVQPPKVKPTTRVIVKLTK